MKTLLRILFILSLNASFVLAAEGVPGVKFLVHHDEKMDGYTLTAGDRGVKLEMIKTHTVIELAPHAQVKLSPDAEPESIELITGMARAHVQKRLNKIASAPVKFLLKTKTATMGVRGTDFVGIATPILGESEIIVFEGNVDFADAANPGDLKHVPAGHWGGIGGRFGASTHELIALPKATLEYFDQVSEVKN